MSRERSILERVRRREAPSERTALEDTNALVTSVLANLKRILNAREGHAPAQHDYGVPAPSEILYSFPVAIDMMQQHLRSCIETYEPRLHQVEVIHVENPDDPLDLLFQVQAELASSEGSTMVTFLTHMDSSGHLVLER